MTSMFAPQPRLPCYDTLRATGRRGSVSRDQDNTHPEPMTRKATQRPIAATDLMAELEADPDFVAHRDQRKHELELQRSQWRTAEIPLRQALQSAGIDVQSVWDLVNTATPYPEALPILLEHLDRPYPDRVREGIARALAVRDAKFGWAQLVHHYQAEPDGSDAKDGLAAAIAAVADGEVVDDVIGLAQDRQHGASRLLLLKALRRSHDPRARAALEQFLRDPQLAIEVRRLLKQ